MGRTVSPSVALASEASLSHKSGRRSRILVVDEESVTADALAEILRQNGYATEAVYDGTSALQRALLSPPELVITDVVLPGMSGVQLAITIKRVYPDSKILLYSGQASTPELIRSPHFAPYDFTLLSKPVRPSDLLALVEHRLGTAGSVLLPTAAESYHPVHLS
jgi:DNA-binding NtrC family response regulator